MQSLLFTPLKIGDLQIKNRVVMPPMCMYKAKNENGCPRCFHRLHYAARALGAQFSCAGGASITMKEPPPAASTRR